jgi:FkbM family methyltransferase
MSIIQRIKNLCVKNLGRKRSEPSSRNFQDIIRETPDGPPITREHVIWAYRLFLDREPESQAAISGKLNVWGTAKQLRADFMTSPEFRLKNPKGFAYTNESNVVIKEFDGQLRLFVDLADQVIGMNIIRGCYEQSEVNFVRQMVKPGHTVLDLGANIGFFTMIIASLVGPSGRVYAFEPIDVNADLLERSITENGFEDRVALERAAVGQSSGFAELVFLKVERAHNSGGAYLAQEGTKLPDGHEIKKADMIALDSYTLRRPIDFVKTDIEGAEPLAFRGAEEILRTDRPIILSELNPVALERVSGCTPAQFIAEMQARGYDCRILKGGKVTGEIADFRGHGVQSVVFLPKAG